jgi:branched-chain amino acid aminotransferase
MADDGKIKGLFGAPQPKASVMRVWSDGHIIHTKKQIDSLNFVLHYGAPACWEGIRAYLQQDGTTKIWKLEEHIKRLFDSAKILGMEIPFTQYDIQEGCRLVVEANGSGNLYLRPIVYTTQDAESVRQKESPIAIDIYAFPINKLGREEGIKARIASMQRGYPQFQMQCKNPANYAMLNNLKNELIGVDELLFCDNQGYVVEATVANIFVVRGDQIFTPPNEGSILPGITRRCVAEILGDNATMFTKYQKHVKVMEKRITRSDLYTADEVFMSGTYAEIVPIIEIDGRKIADGKPGFFTKLTYKTYQDMVQGR